MAVDPEKMATAFAEAELESTLGRDCAIVGYLAGWNAALDAAADVAKENHGYCDCPFGGGRCKVAAAIRALKHPSPPPETPETPAPRQS